MVHVATSDSYQPADPGKVSGQVVRSVLETRRLWVQVPPRWACGFFPQAFEKTQSIECCTPCREEQSPKLNWNNLFCSYMQEALHEIDHLVYMYHTATLVAHVHAYLAYTICMVRSYIHASFRKIGCYSLHRQMRCPSLSCTGSLDLTGIHW